MPSFTATIHKVLLIDDDSDDCAFFKEAVRQLDAAIEVQAISSPREVSAGSGCQPPDLLFLDINMPEKDGFEWLRDIRTRGYTFPVIMYSTANNPAYVQRAYEEGANLYFPKPDSLRILQASLQRLLCFNWQNPQHITDNYYSDGQYCVFQMND